MAGRKRHSVAMSLPGSVIRARTEAFHPPGKLFGVSFSNIGAALIIVEIDDFVRFFLHIVEFTVDRVSGEKPEYIRG